MKVTQKSEVEETKKFQVEAPFIPEVKVVELPSKFLPYSKNCSISYRPYIYGELTEFNESKFSVPEEVAFQLRGITTSFPAVDLAYFDYLAILLLRKISTFGGNQFSFPYKCLGCEKDGKHYSTLMDVVFEDLNVPNLPAVVTIGGQELHFNPLTVGKFIEFINRDTGKSRMVQMLASEVVNLKYEEAEKIIHNASGEDQEVLNYLDEIFFFGVKPIKFKCKNVIGKDEKEKKDILCNYENSIQISPEVLTSPFRDDRESVRSRIRFGL